MYYGKADSIDENLVNTNRAHRSVDRCGGGDPCGALCGHRLRSALRRPTRCARRRTAAVVSRRPVWGRGSSGFQSRSIDSATGSGDLGLQDAIARNLSRGGTRCVSDEAAAVVLRSGGGIVLTFGALCRFVIGQRCAVRPAALDGEPPPSSPRAPCLRRGGVGVSESFDRFIVALHDASARNSSWRPRGKSLLMGPCRRGEPTSTA